MTSPLAFDLGDILGEGAIRDTRDKVQAAFAQERQSGWRRASLPLLGERLRDALSEQCAQIDLLALFAQGWAKVAEVRTAGDPADNPAGKTKYVRLGHHVIEQDFDPVLTVHCGPLVSGPIRLTLTINAAIDAIELAVRDRHLVAVGGGHCDLGARLHYGGAPLAGSDELKRIDIPGEYKLPHPIEVWRDRSSAGH